MNTFKQFKILNDGQRKLLSPKRKIGIAILAIIGVLLGVYFIAKLQIAPKSIATLDMRDRAVEGQNAIELSFWLVIFFGNILSFRTMEVFFRLGFARFLRDLPLRPEAVFLNRMRQTFFEATIFAFLGSTLFIPLALTHPFLGLSAIGNLFLGMWTAVPLSVAAFLYIGTAFAGNQSRDAYGGGGAGFIYGPILGFALVAASALGIKLGFGELIFQGELSNAFIFIVLLVIFLSIASFKMAWSDFSKNYYQLLAKFNEADSTLFDLGNEYQTSDYPGKSKLASHLPPIGAIARNFQLQYRRRFPIQRSLEKLSLVFLIIFFITRKEDSIPLWGITIAGLLLFGGLSNPWLRIAKLPGRIDFVANTTLEKARLKLASIEILPYATLSAILPGAILLFKYGINTSIGLASFCSVLSIAITFAILQLKTYNESSARILPAIVIGTLTVLISFLGPLITSIIETLILLLSLGIYFISSKKNIEYANSKSLEGHP